ncbi:hypothetical protein A2U01_0066339, partial [Trifolium medium]|nr:hypothetical protein [Trifolium medium]
PLSPSSPPTATGPLSPSAPPSTSSTSLPLATFPPSPSASSLPLRLPLPHPQPPPFHLPCYLYEAASYLHQLNDKNAAY